jgi:hypothetical protein
LRFNLLTLFCDVVVLGSTCADWLAFLSFFVERSAFSANRLLDALLGGRVKDLVLSAAGLALLGCGFPSCIGRARGALLLSFIVNWRSDWAKLARFAGAIPHGLLRGADAVSGMQRFGLTFLSRGVVNFSTLTRRVTRVGSEVVSEVIGARLTGLFA